MQYWVYIVVFSVVMLLLAVLFARYVIRRLDSIEQAPASDRREEKLFKLYTEIESMLDSFEEYVGEVHEELEHERAELTELSRRASSLYLQTSDKFAELSEYSRASQVYPAGDEQRDPKTEDVFQLSDAAERAQSPRRESRLSGKDRQSLGAMKTKSQKVRFLMSRGLSLDEVARELGIGKGEVKLIADLDK